MQGFRPVHLQKNSASFRGAAEVGRGLEDHYLRFGSIALEESLWLKGQFDFSEMTVLA